MNLLRNSLGVVLYPWEARIFTGDDIAGFAYEKTYYQVLVDNRDADELPMELETLRISEDTSRNPSDVKVSFSCKVRRVSKRYEISDSHTSLLICKFLRILKPSILYIFETRLTLNLEDQFRKFNFSQSDSKIGIWFRTMKFYVINH